MNNPLSQGLRLKIAINAQFLPQVGRGGVESVLIGLIRALGKLEDGPEEYVIIGPAQEPNWLNPFIGSNQRIVGQHNSSNGAKWKERVRNFMGPLHPPIKSLYRHMISPFRFQPIWPEVPVSNGFYESLNCDIIHFPYQEFVLCSLPTIYNPHDLQHLHFPEFFTPSAIAWRETFLPAGCHLSRSIVVGSNWIKQDLVRHYRIEPDKVQVIPWASPTEVYPNPSSDTLESIKEKYQLQIPFAFYPAMLWEHKNHLRLFEALARLRDQDGLAVGLVCTGGQDPRFWPRLEACIQTLHLQNQVRFLGMVPHEELRAIYRLSQFVIVPTLFEAASGPVFEAWQEGVPVACSTVTSLPEQAGGAALLFDPFSIEAIMDPIRQMVTNEDLRRDMVRKGKTRLQDFSWERTAKAYRAVYRRAARRPLSEEDQYLLQWDWMHNPSRD